MLCTLVRPYTLFLHSEVYFIVDVDVQEVEAEFAIDECDTLRN